MSKQPSTATNLRKRRAALNHIRKQLTMQYHALSSVSCDDRIAIRKGDKFHLAVGEIIPLPEGVEPDKVIFHEPEDELEKGVDLLSDVINCLNRELGRKENSPA